MIPPAAGSTNPAEVALPSWAADADTRGTLEIAPVVLRRIVEHAADEVPGVLHHGRSVGGLEMGEEGPKARVSPAPPAPGGDDEASLDVRLDLTLTYPTPVRATVDAVRAKVAGELARLAGYRLDALAVRVVGLQSPQVPRTVPR